MKLLLVFLSLFALSLALVEPQELDTLVFDPPREQAQFTLMVVCGIHAREAKLTRSICQAIADELSRPYPPNYRVKVVLVPLANPDGLAIVEAGPNASCWRCNKNQVDLNRNFPLVYSNVTNGQLLLDLPESVPGDDEYPGPAPFSEWESRSLDKIMRKHKPDMLISVHTGTLALFPPFDFTSVKPKGYGKMVQVANWLRDGVCDECFVGRSTTYLGYRAYGTLTDYAFYFLGVPFVYTLEAFDAPELHDVTRLDSSLCEQIFAGLEQSKLKEKWLPMFERIYSATPFVLNEL